MKIPSRVEHEPVKLHELPVGIRRRARRPAVLLQLAVRGEEHAVNQRRHSKDSTDNGTRSAHTALSTMMQRKSDGQVHTMWQSARTIVASPGE